VDLFTLPLTLILYTVTVTDANGNISKYNEPITGLADLAAPHTITQSGGTATVIVNPTGGLPPYMYMFDSSGGFSDENTKIYHSGVEGVPPTGLQLVTIEDARGCIYTEIINLDIMP